MGQVAAHSKMANWHKKTNGQTRQTTRSLRILPLEVAIVALELPPIAYRLYVRAEPHVRLDVPPNTPREYGHYGLGKIPLASSPTGSKVQQ